MSVVNKKFVGYAAFDDSEDANRAATILATVGSAKFAPDQPDHRRTLAAAAN
jgi:hypothetical protein